MMSETAPTDEPCPHCKLPVHPEARKCPHCHELIGQQPGWQLHGRRMVTLLGALTAALSVFYALREGYFYIDKQQRQRHEVRSYSQVATQFEQMDSLQYAQQALAKALQLSPADSELQRRHFIVQARQLLRQLDWQSMLPTEQMDEISVLILEGYRLLAEPFDAGQQAQLRVMLARLLPKDRRWNDDKGITKLFARAYELAPADPQVCFYYGVWQHNSEAEKPPWQSLVQQAIAIAPEDPVYNAFMGKALMDDRQFIQALEHLRTAAASRDKELDLDRIRAANAADQNIRRLLVTADSETPIESDDFFGFSLAAREQLIEQVLQQRPNDRNINFIAARFYFYAKQYDAALAAVQLARSDDSLSLVARGYEIEQNRLYVAILAASGQQPRLRSELEQALLDYENSQGIEERLEWGIQGEHNYKVGLQVSTRNKDKGLKILKAYRGYPFALAGVQADDWLISVAHRQPASLSELGYVLRNFQPGSRIPIVVERQGQQLQMELQVE